MPRLRRFRCGNCGNRVQMPATWNESSVTFELCHRCSGTPRRDAIALTRGERERMEDGLYFPEFFDETVLPHWTPDPDARVDGLPFDDQDDHA